MNDSGPRRWRSLRPAVGAILLVALGAAPEEPHWAFQPIRRPEPPAVRAPAGAIRNPIDAFILRGLDENQLKPAPDADRRTLIRRLTFDLIGLPPTPEEVAAFLADERPDAYERVVDRLLASPHYGERWGRHWLDLVRFAETHGYERDDPKPNAWRYRDWVIDAFNRDLPYDRFLVEQLAGDELPDASPATWTATGMYRLGLIDDEPADQVMDRFDQLDDMLKTIGTTMLGLTVHCARCHDHKFDPIPQADYYRLLAFLEPSKPYVRDHNETMEVALVGAEEQERYARKVGEIDRAIAGAKQEIASIHDRARAALLAGRVENDTLGALQTPADRRTAAQKDLVREAMRNQPTSLDAISRRLTAAEKAKQQELERRIAALDATRPPPLPKALSLTDTGPKAKPTHLLLRGDAHKPGAEVAPGFLSVIDPRTPTIAPPPGGKTTGRRLALARWIARGDNPLTARVMVNRLWQHHFGTGLVATPSDFGMMGEEPSHPELLDWLASELVARGWSLKAMHRLMVTSDTYCRGYGWSNASAAADPENALLWRRAPQRLEAEPIRDAILAVSGELNRGLGGPSVRPPIAPAALATQSRPGNGWATTTDPHAAARRSVYVYVKRTLPLPELEVLDAADNAEPCPRRSVTTTAPQALTLLNGDFLHEQAGRFADRLRREAGDEPAAQVDRAFALALARPPTEAERQAALAFLDRQAALVSQRPRPEDRAHPRREAIRALCLVLFNANEFVTVD